MALGLATVTTILVVALYGSAPSPGSGPAPALRAATKPQIDGLTSVLAKDWGRARAADKLWINNCQLRASVDGCVDALSRQIAALQRLREDVSAQRLAGTQLAPIVDGRFLRGVAAALAAKKTVLTLLTAGQFPYGRLPLSSRPLRPLTPGQYEYFHRQDTDPLVCIEPVGTAIQRAMGTSASHPLFLSYPHSMADVVDGGRTCSAAG
jgi:hypothetical protein